MDPHPPTRQKTRKNTCNLQKHAFCTYAEVVPRFLSGGFELVYEVLASLWGGFDPLGVVLTGLRRFGPLWDGFEMSAGVELWLDRSTRLWAPTGSVYGDYPKLTPKVNHFGMVLMGL